MKNLEARPATNYVMELSEDELSKLLVRHFRRKLRAMGKELERNAPISVVLGPVGAAARVTYVEED